MNYKKILKNSKAISPIFATLILIAIAVIAGVVVYMFTSGTLATMTGGGTAAQEKISIQAVQANSTGLTVYAQSTSGTVTITSIIIKDSAGNVVGAPVTLAIGKPVTSTIGSGISVAFTTWTTGTNSYTVTLVSTQGGNFVSPSFTVTI